VISSWLLHYSADIFCRRNLSVSWIYSLACSLWSINTVRSPERSFVLLDLDYVTTHQYAAPALGADFCLTELDWGSWLAGNSMTHCFGAYVKQKSNYVHCAPGSVVDWQYSKTCTHVPGRPAWQTLLLPSKISCERLKIPVPYFAHVLGLFALRLRSRVVDLVCSLCEHDSPNSVAAEDHSCAPENDDCYGRAS
jgi:hypothetical protein